MARPKQQDPSTDPQQDQASDAPADAPRRPPQGIVMRDSTVPHPFRGRQDGLMLVDAESLRVPRTREDGSEYLDDPYLAFPDRKAKGGFAITQVRAEDAAIMLTCDPASGGAPSCRIATDEEVAEHLAVNGRGAHGNLVNRK
jgi:hypothetical protein